MKRLAWLWVLPWSVVVSSREINCTFAPGPANDDGTTYTIEKQTCDQVQDCQILYLDRQIFMWTAPEPVGKGEPDPCAWMHDVTAAFNEMAIARKYKEIDPDLPDNPPKKKPRKAP